MKSMKRKVFFFVFCVILLDCIYAGVIYPLLPIFASDLGASDAAVGRIHSLAPMITFIILPPLGILADRVNKKLLMALSMGILAFSCILYLTASSLFQLGLARFIQGIGDAFVWGSAVSLFALYASEAKRGLEMSLIGIANGAGVIIGPSLGGWAGPKFAFPITGFSALILSLGVLVFLKELKGSSSHSLSKSNFKEELFNGIKNTFSMFRYGCVAASSVAVITIYVAMGVLYVLFPLYAGRDLKFSTGAVGSLLTFFYIFFTLSQPLIGRWSDRVGRVLPINSGLFIMALLLPFVFITEGPLPWALLFLLIGPAVASVYAPAIAFVGDGIDKDHQGHAYGLVVGASFFGLWLGMFLSGQVAESFSNLASALMATVVLLISVIFIFKVAKRKGAALI